MKINETLSIKDIFDRIGKTRYRPIKKAANFRQWQELALEIIAGLKDGKEHKSSIFKYCKENETRARKCFEDCKELGKPYAKYFFKLITRVDTV